MCWELDKIDPAWFRRYVIEPEKAGRISSIKKEIEKLKQEKKAVKDRIQEAWKRIEEICGHPRIQQGAWARAECMVCGLEARESYFMENFSPVVFDVNGKNIEEEKRKAKEKHEGERARSKKEAGE